MKNNIMSSPSAPIESWNRLAIPRWPRPRRRGARFFLLQSVPGNCKSDPYFLELKSEWALSKSAPIACELLNYAYIHNCIDIAYDVSQSILSQDDVPPLLGKLANDIVTSIDNASPAENTAIAAPINNAYTEELLIQKRLAVTNLRHRLRHYPRDSITWSELARAYTALGENEKADRALRVALSLSGMHPYIVLAAIRRLVHIGELDHAFYLAQQYGRSTHDPLILSAALGLSEIVGEKKLPYRLAIDIFNSNPTNPSTSELGVALGTLHIRSGQDRRARKIIISALVNPSENALAQARFLARDLPALLPHIKPHLTRTAASEASALEHFYRSKFTDAFNSASVWVSSETYSHRALLFAARVAFFSHSDASLALEFALEATRTSVSSLPAHNDAAYYAALNNDVALARRHLNKAMSITSKMEEADADKVALIATEGLVLFREGNSHLGKAKYEKAIKLARLIGRKGYGNGDVLAAIALLNLAREEKLAKLPSAKSTLSRALDVAYKYQNHAPSILALTKLLK